MKPVIVASAITAVILIVDPSAYSSGPSHSKHTAPKASSKVKRDTSQEEQRLRIRLEIAPQDHDAYERLLTLLKNRYAFRAQALLDAQWLDKNPNDYFALIDLTSCATAALNDPEFAINAQRAYIQQVERDPSDNAYDLTMSSLASALSKRGRGDEALRLSDQLLQWTPDDAGLWADRAAIQFRLSRFDDALASMRHSVKLDSSSEGTHESLADLFFLAGNWDDAASEYRAALSVYSAKYTGGQTNGSWSDLISSLISVERKYQSEHSLAQMHMKYARALVHLGKFQDAIAETKAALAADKSAITALYERAKIYEAAGDAGNAQKARDAVLPAISGMVSKDEMSRTKALGDPRVAFLMTGDTSSEFAPLDFSDELIPLLENRAELTTLEKIALADAFLTSGAIDKGRSLWESLVTEKSDLDTAQGHSALAQALLKAGDVEHAVPHLRRAYELDPLNLTYQMDYERSRTR